MYCIMDKLRYAMEEELWRRIVWKLGGIKGHIDWEKVPKIVDEKPFRIWYSDLVVDVAVCESHEEIPIFLTEIVDNLTASETADIHSWFLRNCGDFQKSSPHSFTEIVIYYLLDIGNSLTEDFIKRINLNAKMT